MSTILPSWPHFLFAVLEPISLIAGWWAATFDTHAFITNQTLDAVLSPQSTIPRSAQIIAYQLGNLYGLSLLVGIAVLYSTSEPKVVRNYMIALAIADVTHVYTTYLGLGWDAWINVGHWNALAWGNIGATSFLFLNRVAYLLGVFGSARSQKDGKKVE
ncbi:hypothetical protein AJ80_01608 [Polytolypa hystricis UAMH7299]|uniref:DUF7704 domain-containing protein n=1 Tax=Polytolypa hystricis (strain UAMH7299) TaxID=1447883 RepID=A0A2B7Z0Q4_POLH7|nr:hypothetical protein AJ80_01608 [Polytolypa hystricis UAMH7299]